MRLKPDRIAASDNRCFCIRVLLKFAALAEWGDVVPPLRVFSYFPPTQAKEDEPAKRRSAAFWLI
jgi:hypothetical protein